MGTTPGPSPGPTAGYEPPDPGDVFGRDPQEILGDLGASWGWALGLALATLLPGILVLVWPDETLHVLAVVVGLQLLVTGVFRFVTAFSRGRGRNGSRMPGVLIAIVAVLAGVLCLRHPMQTIAALSLIVGAFWLVSGLLTAFIAIEDRGLAHRGVAFALGAVGVIAGIVVLAFPAQSAVALARLLGLWLVLIGVVELAGAVALRAATRGRTGPKKAGAQ
ncbi:HdeD family acid-resistance protein [Streptomyces sp. NBC_00390]|uniref:HdeD family acid-resistance protein n=1 Tax=Streptomyces sp. NBC_00390 TaxID=2975736 RepID=UPI002E24DBCC